MNVLSLFDGMSAGQLALERVGIKVSNYFASEIDKHAIKVTQANYPQTTQVGCVTKIKVNNLPKIDLLIGGSPCQGFSYSGKLLAFEDPRSKLFFEYVRLLKELKPKYFLLENVKMKNEFQDVISEYLGVEPVEICSSLVSAQIRKRLYWTNIGELQQPKDVGVELSSILEDLEYSRPADVRGRRCLNASIVGRRVNEKGIRKDEDKTIPITQCLEVRKLNTNKSNCLTTVAKDNVLTNMGVGRHLDAFKNKLPFRNYTATEYERLQTFPDGYSKDVSDTQRKKMLGNGWTVDVITHIFKGLKPQDVA